MNSCYSRFILRTCLLSVMSLLWLVACGDSTWEDVASFGTGDGEIRAGDLVRLEPASFEPREISGLDVFTFNGNLLNNSSDLELSGNVTVHYGRREIRGEQTITATKSIQWAANESQKAVTITFFTMGGPVLSGDGHLYFYLTDLNDTCVSNIVKWPVTFDQGS